MTLKIAWAVALAFATSMQAASAQDVERFYAGRKLSVVIGHEVGTGFDLYGRVLARHMGRFIPGNPKLVPENMIGVAGFAAANWTLQCGGEGRLGDRALCPHRAV